LAEFSKRGGNGGKQAVRFPRFPPRGSFHSLRSKKRGPYSSSNEFFGERAYYFFASEARSSSSRRHWQLRFCAPTTWAKLQDVAVMKQPIEHGGDRGGIT
jgi:hypothetical protein